MKTLELEQISTLQAQHVALVQTARSGATLANLVSGAILGCDATTDPDGLTKRMLVSFLKSSGFKIAVEDAETEGALLKPALQVRARCAECNQRCAVIDGMLESHMEIPSSRGGRPKMCVGSGQRKR